MDNFLKKGLFLTLQCFFFMPFAHADSTDAFVKAAEERTTHFVTYDGSYRVIDYPMGDVPNHIGVCTDVVIRSYRSIGIDLQQLVHEDMKLSFSSYPQLWGLSKPDKNIDHRRVPNLRTFFSRKGAVLDVTDNPENYQPGDIVTWLFPNNLPHIGIVTANKVSGTKRRTIIHNAGGGTKEEDFLFSYPITGHYRFGLE